MRRLEARIGELLPREQGQRSDLLPNHGEEVLNDRQKAEFRQMAAHPEIVEQVIAESTDDAPASRRKVMEAIQQAHMPNSRSGERM
jgi:Fe-S-cluster formation regulator IscX/YfhJ